MWLHGMALRELRDNEQNLLFVFCLSDGKGMEIYAVYCTGMYTFVTLCRMDLKSLGRAVVRVGQ